VTPRLVIRGLHVWLDDETFAVKVCEPCVEATPNISVSLVTSNERHSLSLDVLDQVWGSLPLHDLTALDIHLGRSYVGGDRWLKMLEHANQLSWVNLVGVCAVSFIDALCQAGALEHNSDSTQEPVQKRLLPSLSMIRMTGVNFTKAPFFYRPLPHYLETLAQQRGRLEELEIIGCKFDGAWVQELHSKVESINLISNELWRPPPEDSWDAWRTMGYN